MPSQIGQQSPLVLRQAMAVATVVSIHLASTARAGAVLESGTYQTLPGATVEERGDWVPNGIRVVPISASLTFDLQSAQPSLTAVIPDAVWEGGDPFSLTVRSSTGTQMLDGTYRFTGDYLRDLQPAGTQYLFDWKFSPSSDGQIVWNGVTDWAGGHLWQVTVSDLTIVPEPGTLALLSVGIAILWALRLKQKAFDGIARLRYERHW